MPGKTVLILGGGVGGVVAASELRKRLGKEHRVVLVDKEGKHIFWPSLLWLQVGLREPARIVKDLASLEKKGIEVVRGQIEAIDPGQKSIQVDGKKLEGDYLVVSLGAQLAPEAIPGLAQAGHNLYTLEGSTAIRQARRGITGGDLVVLVARTPFKCPAAPYEAAMLLDYDLRKRKLRNKVSVSVYTPEPGPMPVTGPEVSAGVKQLLEHRNIVYHPQHQVTEVDSAKKTLKFANGVQAGYDFLAYVPPHIAPPVVKAAGLTAESGWVSVDRKTMETKFQDVFAIGDVTLIPLAVGMPLPKAGVFATREAQAVAQTMVSRIGGKEKTGVFDGYGKCYVEVGGGKAGFGSGNFYAEPKPQVKLQNPTRYGHLNKVLFEKSWLWRL